MSLVLFTCMVGLLIAPYNVDLKTSIISLLAVAIGSGAAGALNMWYESDLDALMTSLLEHHIMTFANIALLRMRQVLVKGQSVSCNPDTDKRTTIQRQQARAAKGWHAPRAPRWSRPNRW